MEQSQKDYLYNLFDKLSQKINKPINEMKPFYFILKQNWYDNEQALREVTDQQYNQMKIPGRLVSAIKQQLGIKNKNMPINTITQTKNNQLQQIGNQNIVKKQNEIALNQFNMVEYTNKLQQHLIKKFNNDLSRVEEIFQTLYKIIHNIILDPYEIKYRSLKKTNGMVQRIILSNKNVFKFLSLFGFQEDNQKIYLHAPRIHELIFIQQVILSKIQNIKKNNFQPFANIKLSQKPIQQTQMNQKPSNAMSGSFNEQFSKQKLSQMKYVDALQKLIQFRHRIMSKPPQDRQLKIYHRRHESKDLSSLPVVNMQQQFQKSEDKIIQNYWSSIVKQNIKNSNFQSKRKQQFQFLIKQKIHKETIIKIKLPNQLIIEARFGPLQKLKQVVKVICQIVIGDIYLFHAPPPKKFDKDMQKTLFELDSVPMGSFYLGINGDWYIQNKYASIILK